MIETVKECECGRLVEPAYIEEDTKYYKGRLTQWFCECGRLSREYSELFWTTAFYEDLAKQKELYEAERKLTPKQRKQAKRKRYFEGKV